VANGLIVWNQPELFLFAVAALIPDLNSEAIYFRIASELWGQSARWLHRDARL